MRTILLSLFISTAAYAGLPEVAEPTCSPPPDLTQAQYVVGYGSLMQDSSRVRTAPHAGAARPVMVKGYQRGWFTRSKGPGLGITYLGVVEDVVSSLNAVLYQLDAKELAATDRRERSYCRVAVSPSAVRFLAGEKANGQIWIYEIRPGEASVADEEHPVVQSYVDVFLDGCLEQEERFHLDGFAAQCVRTTNGWSANWVNDRVYPRRPLAFQPHATQIDQLLADEIPAYWWQIQMEGGRR
jgi:hypothetical protein